MISQHLEAIIAAEVARQLRASRLIDGVASGRVDPYNIPFRNDSGEVVPPFAIMRPTGLSFNQSGNWFVTVTKPDDTFRRRYYINGPVAVPDGGYGDCSDGTYPTLASFPGTGTFNSHRTNFGVESGSWELKKGGVGRFKYLGGGNYAQNDAFPTAVSVFQQADCETLIVQATGAVSPGSSYSFNVHDADGETSIQITALCQIYPPGIGADGGTGSSGGFTSPWPDDTVFGAHFYGIASAVHADDWRLAWGYSEGTPI